MMKTMTEREAAYRSTTHGAAFSAQEREMTAASRALHDETAQSLACALVELETALGTAGMTEGPRENIACAATHLDGALKGVLEISASLHPPVIDSLGLEAALRGLVKSMNATHRIDYRLVSVGGDGAVPGEVNLNLYRVAQEALRNAAEHSGAGEVLVFLNCGYCGIDLVINDDGSGFPAKGAGNGLGFASMQERVESIGGTFTCSSDHRGVTIKVHVPLAR